jgi:Protein of unknown function (DUF3631)
VVRFKRRDAVVAGDVIRDRLAALAAGAVEALRFARPTIPVELGDRAADGWEPLLAIADLAGGDWPDRARRAAKSLSGHDSRDADNDDLAVRLLDDIRRVLDEIASDRIASKDLAARLCEIEESPWGDLRGRPLDSVRLARLLKPLEIRPRTVRFDDVTRAKGYLREQFQDAFARYLPVRDVTP